MTTTKLERAAKHIDATELANGDWAHFAAETGRWYVVTAGELEELCDYLDHRREDIRQDAYSHWCAGTTAQKMPEGWEPGADDDGEDEEMRDESKRTSDKAG